MKSLDVAKVVEHERLKQNQSEEHERARDEYDDEVVPIPDVCAVGFLPLRLVHPDEGEGAHDDDHGGGNERNVRIGHDSRDAQTENRSQETGGAAYARDHSPLAARDEFGKQHLIRRKRGVRSDDRHHETDRKRNQIVRERERDERRNVERQAGHNERAPRAAATAADVGEPSGERRHDHCGEPRNAGEHRKRHDVRRRRKLQKSRRNGDRHERRVLKGQRNPKRVEDDPRADLAETVAAGVQRATV